VTVSGDVTIGGSEAAAVLGCDPFLSATMVAARKLGLAPPQRESEAMRLGTASQAWHASLLEADGYQVLPAPTTAFERPDLEWWRGHLDAFCDVRLERGVLELKARGVAPDERTWLRDQVQALHYLACTGLDVALVSVLHGGYGGWQRSERVVVRDDAALELMTEAYVHFRAMVRRGRLPEPDGSDSAREFYRNHKLEPGKVVRLSRAGHGHVKAARFHAEREKWHKAEAERHWQDVQHEMGNATHALSPLDDAVLAEWSDETYSYFDRKALKAAHPAIEAEFSERRPRRRWLVK
jgi:predicted phage-related endonuclease